MKNAQFISLVENMRLAQSEYFQTRTYASLMKAKSLERQVDRELPSIKRQENENLPTQLELSFDCP